MSYLKWGKIKFSNRMVFFIFDNKNSYQIIKSVMKYLSVVGRLFKSFQCFFSE